MKRTTRYMSIGVVTAVCLMVSIIDVVFAQNLGGIISIESEATAIMKTDKGVESFPDVSLIPASQLRDTSMRDLMGIPEYQAESSNYTLGIEDVIEISVLRHSEVSGAYIINSEGKIQYEFIGDVKIEGMKKDEIKALLTELLSEFVIAPDVTVKIIGYNSKIVYVIGEVRAPGKIFMRGDTITVREALIQAGLPLLTGKIAKSRLITPSDSGRAERKIVDVNKLLYEGDLRENLIMKPGDTLYIPPTLMTKALRVIQPVSTPVRSATSTGRRLYTGGF